MAMPATQIRRGMVIVSRRPAVPRSRVHAHHTPGNLRAMIQTKLKNLRNGNGFEHRFPARPILSKRRRWRRTSSSSCTRAAKPGTYHGEHTVNFDQLEMDEEMLGDNAQWMQAGMKILAEYYDGRPIGIELPQFLVLEVVDTAPVMKTATKTASTKPAKLDNGVMINVPEFVASGERVRVNPNTGEYMDRAK